MTRSDLKTREDAEPPSQVAAGARASVRAGYRSTLPSQAVQLVPLAAKEKIGLRLRYQIIREIGHGGMGVVYLARDEELGRRVAIKLLPSLEPELARHFIIEARATARCTHDHIVVIHEIGEHAGCPFMVLEYLEGKTLAAYRNSHASRGHGLQIIAAITRALVHAHAEGIVHRDLTPDNVFLTDTGGVKVLDFGIAMLLQGELEREVSEQAYAAAGNATTPVGTLRYMSPEQWGVGGPIDRRTDIWAVGLMLFELLTGRHPLEAHLHPEGWVSDLAQPFPSLRTQAPEVPEELAQIVARCLRKHKEQRYPNATELLRALEPFLPGHFSSWSQPAAGPYAGLRAFHEEDAARFFGRSTEVSSLLTRLIETPLVGVVGPSGIGKSSLVRAGVGPTLKRTDEGWSVLTLRPGRDPLAALARALVPFGPAELPGALRKKLEIEPGYFGAVLRASCAQGRRILIVLDQFEECFTLGASLATRRAFVASLLGAADDIDSPLRVVLTLRADFMGRVAEHPELMRVLCKGLCILGAPSPAGLRDALIQPAELAGYRFETAGMVQEMVDSLQRTPAGLPLLQFAAAQLWERRDPDRRFLTERAYAELGGVAGALVTHANGVMAKLAPESLQVCRALFMQLITEQRTRVARSVRELQQLIPESATFQDVLDELIDSRLLVVHTSDGEAMVEIVHESLIRTWPTLEGWLDQGHAQSLLLARVLSAAREWDSHGRGEGLLWGPELAAELARFVASFDSAQPPQLALEFAAAVVTRAKRRARTRGALLIGSGLTLTVLLGLMTTLSISFAHQKSVAERSAEHAQQLEFRERSQADALRTSNVALEQRTKELARTTARLELLNGELELQKQGLQDRERQLVDANELANRERVRADQKAREAQEAAQRDRARVIELERLLGHIPDTLTR